MKPISYSYYEIDRLMQDHGGRRAETAPRHGSKRARKWYDQKGPNPLVMMGLDRS